MRLKLVAICIASVAAKLLLDCGSGVTVHQFNYGGFTEDGNFQYLIQSGSSAVAVDLAWRVEEIQNEAKSNGAKLLGSLYTNKNSDHMGSLNGRPIPGPVHLLQLSGPGRDQSHLPDFLRSEDKGKFKFEQKFWIGSLDMQGATAQTHGWAPEIMEAVNDGDVIKPFGEDGPSIVAIDTPGHTLGHVAYWLPPTKGSAVCANGVLFSGDSLHVGGVGNTNMVNSDEGLMMRSLKRLSALHPKTIVLPGENTGSSSQTTIEAETLSNSLFQKALREVSDADAVILPGVIELLQSSQIEQPTRASDDEL